MLHILKNKTTGALVLAMSVIASPAFAASGPFVSLRNTNFVVLIAFIIFVGILLYYGVPGMVGKMLDQRSDTIRAELEVARGLREEAQALLASFERKQKDVQAQAARIVASAKEETEAAAVQAKADIAVSVERRLVAAGEQIASAQASAVKEVRDTAITVAVEAARTVVGEQMAADQSDRLVSEAIATVADKLH